MSLTDDEVDQGKDMVVASVQEWSGNGDIWFDYIKR
jgi:hypothetical protein